MSDDNIAFDLEAPNLRQVLAGLKEVDPRLATNLRRQLRSSGDGIIDAQRAILAVRPPRVGGSTHGFRTVKAKGRRAYIGFRRDYHAGETRTGGESKLRDAIAAGLRTRVQTSEKRQGVQVKTTGPRDGKVNMARVWQAKQFRHPLFGNRNKYITQFGQPYFFAPVTDELRELMSSRVEQSVTDALNAASSR